ncbi:MAG: hypothetical protein FWJ85_00815 [Solitalea sp.]
MKRNMLILLLVLPGFASAFDLPDVRQFFADFKKAAVSRDVSALKKLIYPFRDEVEDMQAELIESILNGDESRRGDGAFSIRALDSLITKHLDKIQLIDPDLYTQLSRDRIFGPVLSRFPQQKIYVMDYRDARMILLRSDDRLQLFFWENLNNLLRPTN